MQVVVDVFHELERGQFYFTNSYKLKRVFFSEVFLHVGLADAAILPNYVTGWTVEVFADKTPQVPFDFNDDARHRSILRFSNPRGRTTIRLVVNVRRSLFVLHEVLTLKGIELGASGSFRIMAELDAVGLFVVAGTCLILFADRCVLPASHVLKGHCANHAFLRCEEVSKAFRQVVQVFAHASQSSCPPIKEAVEGVFDFLACALKADRKAVSVCANCDVCVFHR